METKTNTAGGWFSIIDYQRIIRKHLPDVLIKCTKYTASRRLAEFIAVYVFICVYHLAQKPDNHFQIPAAIELMLEIIGKDLSDGTGGENAKSLYCCDLEYRQAAKRIIETVLEYLLNQN